MTRLSDWTNTKWQDGDVGSYYVCLKDRKQRRRPKAILAALCIHCRRNCLLAGRPQGPRKKRTTEGKND